LKTPFKPVDFDPFAESKRPKLVPTTESQREIWTSVKLGGDSANCAYNESVSLRLQGHLDYIALIGAVNSVVSRHDALRSTFSTDGTSMMISSSLVLELPVFDLTTSNDKPAEQDGWIKREAETPFSLENGPLFRVNVLKMGQTDHILVLTAHHIICDGWSISIVMQDIAGFYNAGITGGSYEKEPAVQFSQYAMQQQQDDPGGSQEMAEKYWLNQFEGVTETIELPIDKARPAFRTFNARRIDVEFSKADIDKLKQIGAKSGCSLVNTLTVAFEVFLYRITGNENIVLGIPAAGQSVTGQFDLVGHCVNLLPLKSRMVDGTFFLDHLQKRKKEILDAFDHQQYTFGSLVKMLNLPRDPGRIPLVPVIFNVDTGVFDGVRFEGLELTFYSNPRSFENFEIFVNAANYNGRFIMECTFNTDLFDEDIMQQRMKEFGELIHGIVREPATAIDKLPVLSQHEIEVSLVSLNQTKKEYPRRIGIHGLFEEQVKLHPNETALVSGNKSLTYSELNSRANILANHLIGLGIGEQSFVALCIDRTADMVTALLAIMKSGAAYLPIDPTFPKDRIQLMLDDAGVDMLLSEKKHIDALGLQAAKIFLLDEGWEEKTKKNIADPGIALNENHRMYVIYTSGSTGKPKGVQVAHDSVVNLLVDMQRRLRVSGKDNLLAVTTISFDIAGLELYLPLISGVQLTLATKEEVVDVGKLIEKIEKQKCTILQATPVTWRMLTEAGWKGNNEMKVLCGGEALPVDLAERLLPLCGELWNVYGPTETTIWSTAYQVPRRESIRSHYTAIGKPVANTKIYVLDKNMIPVPQGIAGELYIGGDGVSLGYLNRPELNNEKFVADPFDQDKNKKIYRSGDLVRYRKDGNLEFISRIDNQVKVRGYRIELGEIEAVIATHPAVKTNVVITRKDKSGENRLIAYYIPVNDQSFSVEKIRLHLQEKLPDYMVPSAFVEVKEFPLTPNGKIDRKALPEPEIQAAQSDVFVGARTPNENLLSSIWCEILGLSRVSVQDDFFKLGGHSLLAVRLMMDIEKHRGVKLPLAILFTNATIEKLARVMDTEVGNQVWHSIVPIKTNGHRPPLYFAHGVSGNVFKYHALSGLLPYDQPCYGLQAYGLNGKDEPFDNIEEMAAYHIKEILNFQPEGTTFSLAGGSFGGYLAYEMARQLVQMGRKVDLVALIDIDAATSVEFMPFFQKHFTNLKIFIKRLINRAVHIIKADKHEREKYLSHKLKSFKTKKELDLWLNKEEVEKNMGADQASYFNKIEDACYKALVNYKIKPYTGKVILFRAKSGYFSVKYDFDLGWNYYAKGGVDIFEVPGDHNSIFNKGNVEEMARIFSDCLDNAQSK